MMLTTRVIVEMFDAEHFRVVLRLALATTRARTAAGFACH
jgi:hypothetical protein